MMKPRLAEGRGPAQSAQLGNSHRDKLTLAEDGHTCQAFSKPFAFTKAPPTMRWAGLFLQLIDEEAEVQSGQATNPRSQSSGGRASFRPKQAAQSRAWIKVPLWGAVRFSLFPRTQGHLSWSHCLGLAERQSAPGKPGHGSPRLGGWQSQSLCDYTHGGAPQGPERLSNLSKVTQLTVG